MAVKRLAEIVREVFPDRYDPAPSLQKLFSFSYTPEQDHHPDYLLALTEKYGEHKVRLRRFLDCVEARRESDDTPLVELYERTLRVYGYADYADITAKTEEGQKRRRDLHLRFVEESPKEQTREFLFDNIDGGASPIRLCALWMIQHEAQLDDREQKYLIGVIAMWPSWRKNRDAADTMRESIYAKMKPVLDTKLSHCAGERMRRRHAVYQSSDAGSLPDISNALHDLDHRLSEWAYTLGAS